MKYWRTVQVKAHCRGENLTSLCYISDSWYSKSLEVLSGMLYSWKMSKSNSQCGQLVLYYVQNKINKRFEKKQLVSILYVKVVIFIPTNYWALHLRRNSIHFRYRIQYIRQLGVQHLTIANSRLTTLLTPLNIPATYDGYSFYFFGTLYFWTVCFLLVCI